MADFEHSSPANNFSDISEIPLYNFRSCIEAAERYYFWIFVVLILPPIINCGSLLISLTTIIHLRRLKSVTEAVISSTHWLARTANRVGLGDSAHNALMEYAKKKNLQKLVPVTAHKNGNRSASKVHGSSERP